MDPRIGSLKSNKHLISQVQNLFAWNFYNGVNIKLGEGFQLLKTIVAKGCENHRESGFRRVLNLL